MTMNRRLFFSLTLAMLLALSGCVGATFDAPTATPTPVYGVVDAGLELIRQDMYLRLTQQVIDNQRIEAGARMTATQVVIDAAHTQQARSDYATATERSAQTTAQVWQVTVDAAKNSDAATQQAQATGTAVYHLGTTATVVAAATATSDHRTQMAPIWAAEEQAAEARARKTEIELRQAQATEVVDAWWLYVLVFVLALAFLYYLWKKSQVGVILDRGRLRIVMVGKTALNPDLMFRPVMDFSDGQIQAPRLDVPDETQRQITHEAKIVDAISFLPPSGGGQGMKLLGSMTGQQSGSVNIQVLQPGQLSDIRRELDGKLEDDE